MSSFCLLFFALLFGPTAADPYRPMVGEVEDYLVEKAEDIIRIAESHGLAVDHIAFANGLPVDTVRVAEGTVLTIPRTRLLPANPPRTGLVLNLPERGLFFFKDGKFQRFIPVSVGRPPDAKTPVGSFHLIERIKDPTWYPPSWADSQKPVPPGPDNPLGNRWIGLSSPRVGIHGTNDPLNVGASVTHGCIRCYPKDVERLFEEVKVGLPIRIEYETAKLGKAEDGTPYIVTFPDIYDLSDTQERAKKLLIKAGYGKRLKDKNFVTKLALNLGTPIELIERPQASPKAAAVEKKPEGMK